MWFKRSNIKLSIIVIVFNMEREARRTLHSLTKEYQKDVSNLNYEVLVIDNGSDAPLGEEFVKSYGSYFSYYYLDNPPPSPAYAINFGVEKSRGEFVCIVIDGAHMLTPGVLKYFQYASGMFENPVVTLRYWFLGPGQQGETLFNGYNTTEEDKLLDRINWPSDGYRLFEIGVFIGINNPNWFTRFFESNYLFIRKTLFYGIGGANRQFDIAGGGFLNLDLLRECTRVEGITLVSILGEASFHQVHGGTTTNVSAEEREAKVAIYRQQYLRIRGEEYSVPTAPIQYIGHMPPQALV